MGKKRLTVADEATIDMLKAITMLTNLGLRFESSERQAKNGTLFFRDPKEPYGHIGCAKYGIFLSGYARKYIIGGFSGREYEGYQLNKTRKAKRTTSYGLDHWTYETTERILLPGNYLELAKIVKKTVLRSREKFRIISE